ncbi:MAG: gliding motility lipoprotein GldH [Schleiferiaceae bacterium]
MFRLKKSYFLLMSLLLFSCGNPPVVQTLISNVDEVWWQDSALSVDISIVDTSAVYRVSFRLRHTSEYPYSNLFLFRDVLSETQTEYQDTVEIRLVNSGSWVGKGIGPLKTINLPYHQNGVKFPRPGNYRFVFYHGMRDEPLKGIKDLALVISSESSIN